MGLNAEAQEISQMERIPVDVYKTKQQDGFIWVGIEEKASMFRLMIGLLVVVCTVALPGDPVAHICGLLFGYGLAKSHLTSWLLLVVSTLTSVAVFAVFNA